MADAHERGTFAELHPRGSSASDVLAVGDRGMILHYDGSAWIPEGKFSGFDFFHDVWRYPVGNHSEIFVVGASGVIPHHDGAHAVRWNDWFGFIQ